MSMNRSARHLLAEAIREGLPPSRDGVDDETLKDFDALLKKWESGVLSGTSPASVRIDPKRETSQNP